MSGRRGGFIFLWPNKSPKSYIFLSGSSLKITHQQTLIPFLQPSWPSSRCGRELATLLHRYIMQWQCRGYVMCVCDCVCVSSDLDRGGLERGDVQRYSFSRRSEVWHVVLHLLYSAHSVRKLYLSFFQWVIDALICFSVTEINDPLL